MQLSTRIPRISSSVGSEALGGPCVDGWRALKVENIILISRSGMKSPSALSIARELQEAGVQLRAYACDVSDFDQLEQTPALCDKEMPPIRGVIGSAMVLRVNL